jgi:predicted transcriptional regulator
MENVMEANILEDEIIEVWRTLSLSQKQSVIQLIHSFKEEEVEWNTEEIEAYNKEIDEAEQEIARGEYVTHEEVIKSFQKWK